MARRDQTDRPVKPSRRTLFGLLAAAPLAAKAAMAEDTGYRLFPAMINGELGLGPPEVATSLNGLLPLLWEKYRV